MPAHHSSEEDISFDEWMSSNYSPSWSSKKEDLEEEDEADVDDDDDDFDSDGSNSDSDLLASSQASEAIMILSVRGSYLD